MTRIRKVSIAGTCTLLLLALQAELKSERLSAQVDLQAHVTQTCPLVWANLEKVRAMPDGPAVLKWCPQA